MNPSIPKNSAKRAIVEGIFPKCSVQIFNIPFTFYFLDILSSTVTPKAQLEYFEKVVSFKHLSGKEFIKNLPAVYYQEIVKKFLEKYAEVVEILLVQLDEFIESYESRNYWQLCKSSNMRLVLNIENGLNYLQQKWILINSQKDKQEIANLITQVFDALKPWLNSELYSNIKEMEENQRENRFYDDSDMSKEDARIRAKAAAMLRNIKTSVDLDEISIEENK